jgi:hypothetical protein
MRIVAVLGTATAGALAVGGLAIAKSPPSQPLHPVPSHKCAVHERAYRATGDVVSWSATQTSSGAYTGTITVHITNANHHASGALGSDVTYGLSGARVVLSRRADPPAAGDPVNVIGKIAAVAKRCTDRTHAGTVTVRMVTVHAPVAAS